MKIWRAAMAGVAAVVTLATAARADLSSGIISYWPLDEIDGSTTPDLATGNIVNIVGGLSVDPGGVFSNAFSFPSTLSYFTVNSSAASGLPIYKSPQGYTVSAWVKGPPGATHYVFTEGSTANANALLLIQSGSTAAAGTNLDIYIRTDGAAVLVNHVTSTAKFFDNTWHHFAWVDNKGKCALYVDGNLDPKNFNYNPSGTFALNVTTVGGLVRASVATNVFSGFIDNVALWQRPLSQAEVQNFMSNSIPLPIVQTAPIVQSITPSKTNALGDYVTLSELTQGAFPITYQWYQGGVALSGQTSNSLTLTTLTTPGTNVYTIIASNPLGSASNDITITVPPDPSNNVSAGLISYWPLDTINTDASNVMTTPDLYSHDDFTLSGNSGSAPALTTGEFANALAFDGSQLDYAGFAGGPAIFNNPAYSVSLWVNGQPGSQTRVFSQSSTTGGSSLFTIGTDPTGFLQNASILVRNDAVTPLVNNLGSSGVAFDGNWHHIVWVDQNGYALLYIDGVLDPVSFSYTRTGTFSFNELSIGAIVRSTVANAFSGFIDEVGIWNRRLTYSEIQQLQTSTPPPPTSIFPPAITSIVVSPVDPTNNLYRGDPLTLTAVASGTAPLHYQWLKNGQLVSGATSNVLSFPSPLTTDSGAYSLTVSNSDPVLPGGGVATSAVIQVTVQPYTPITNGLAFSVDFDMLGSPNTQPGFFMFNTSLSGIAYTNAGANGIRMTIAAVGGGALADRDRIAPPEVTNNAAITQAQLYNDFIFVNTTTNGAGMTVLLEHLAPNTSYGVTIWSFDTYSPVARVSDWYEISSGTAIPMKTPYSFNGSVAPTADYDDTLGGLLTSTAGGKLQFRGTNDLATNVAVFIDAIQLVANPVVTITSATVAADGNFQITAQGQFPGQALTFLTSPDLTPGSWQPVSNGVVTATHGPNTTVEIPFTTSQQFFRAVASQ